MVHLNEILEYNLTQNQVILFDLSQNVQKNNRKYLNIPKKHKQVVLRNSYIQGYLELAAKNCTLDVPNKVIGSASILLNRTTISYSYKKNNPQVNNFLHIWKNLV